jgi:hypothetical protein
MLLLLIKIILGAALLVGSAGCGYQQGSVMTAGSGSITGSRVHPQDEARTNGQVVVSRSLGFGRVNSDPYGTFTEKEQVDAFTKAVSSAEKMQGVLDVIQPDYDVVIEQDGKRAEIHLWLDAGSEHGMYTYVTDTSTGYRLTAEATRELYDLIWGIRYEPMQAATNGDFVNAHGKVSNLDVWEKFVRNVKAGVRDEVQVVQYTDEGAPIFDNLSFDGEMIMHKYDNTHDAFGMPVKRIEYCKSIEERNSARGKEYKLASCGDGFAQEGILSLLIP